VSSPEPLGDNSWIVDPEVMVRSGLPELLPHSPSSNRNRGLTLSKAVDQLAFASSYRSRDSVFFMKHSATCDSQKLRSTRRLSLRIREVIVQKT
jgi:hypothetical protein